ncbi:MAG: radical SAM protein, partial [Chloroflexia bacterium]|nr:radical SAM protein [Chloroflexia bacterium]
MHIPPLAPEPSLWYNPQAMRILSTSTRNYWRNLLRLARGQRLLYPLAATYYVTTRCNLNCSYCEDFGRHAGGEPGLSLAEACQVLAAIRSGTDRLILTGGEPLLYPDIDALVQHARRALGFRLTLLSNASLLAEHESILPHLERLVVSLDTVDPQRWSRVIDAPLPVARTILDNVRAYAGRQREWGFRLILNCVLTPQGLGEAEALLEFCRQHDVLISFSPQAVHNWPHYDLLVSPEYKALLRRLLELKRQGAPILASRAYLRTLLDLTPYSCYPTLIPRVMPNGDLVYPCRPIE